jgi:hypothetical protein
LPGAKLAGLSMDAENRLLNPPQLRIQCNSGKNGSTMLTILSEVEEEEFWQDEEMTTVRSVLYY